MGNSSSNSGTMKAHTHTHHSKHGDITCTRRHKYKHRRTRHKRSHFGRRTRRYRGGVSPSPLRRSISANKHGIPSNSSPPYRLVIGPRKSKHRSELSLHKILLRANAINERKKEEEEEKKKKRELKDKEEGYVKKPTKRNSRFTVSEKIERISEEEE